MNKRDELQEQYAQLAFEKKRGILLLTPRFGKCRVGVKLFQKLGGTDRILIVYPEITIRRAWEEEFEKMQYFNPNVLFSTYLSLHKYMNEYWDWLVFDEIHKVSENQIVPVKHLEAKFPSVALTGTLSRETKKWLLNETEWSIIASYKQESGIEDGIVSDYRIHVITVPLDNQQLIQYSKKKKTEKKQFNDYTWIINKLRAEGKDTMFATLGRRRVIQGSISKLQKTKELLSQFKDERVLVFSGLIKIANQLGIPVQHSKSEDNLTDFVEGRGNHLALVKMGGMGITYKPLNRVIINSFDSNSENLQQQINRAMSLEFDNPNKVAEIYIVSSDEEVELNWLMKALQPFDQNKIEYL